ncbi:putative DNA-directed RNA polymerase II subunit [Dirofilaria immitis]
MNWMEKERTSWLYGTGECTDRTRTVNSSSAIEYVLVANLRVYSAISGYSDSDGCLRRFPKIFIKTNHLELTSFSP